ncbi:MAG: hypothetical protein CMK59_07675 [Proteobacteria bacterium]|nr:hypothetical protein [Pseudomonadota bacterium]
MSAPNGSSKSPSLKKLSIESSAEQNTNKTSNSDALLVQYFSMKITNEMSVDIHSIILELLVLDLLSM